MRLPHRRTARARARAARVGRLWRRGGNDLAPKTNAALHAHIVQSLGVDALGRVLFATDALAEARAAAAAGMQVATTNRPGNVPLPAGTASAS